MNNARFQGEVDVEESITPLLEGRAGELATLIEILGTLNQSREWSSLKAKEFDPEIVRIESLLKTESKKRPLEQETIYYLQGRLDGVKKMHVSHLLESYRLELMRIKSQLKPPDGAG
jgi:hypothetical protein